MTALLRSLALLAALLSPLTATAQGYGPGPGMGPMFQDPAGLPALKQKLGVTAAQEPQWAAYVDAVTTQSRTRESFHQSMPTQAMSPAEWQEQREGRQQAMAAILAETRKSRDALSAVLDPPQRAILERETPAAADPWGGHQH